MRSWRRAAKWRALVAESVVRVECYSGHKADERPLRILFDTQTIEIAEIEDRWYSPGATYFRALAESGDRYVLRHDDAQDSWTLEGFRASAKTKQRVDTKINKGV